MIEVREVLRVWLAGAGLRTVARQAGVDRKTEVPWRRPEFSDHSAPARHRVHDLP